MSVTYPASEKQVAFIERLLAERQRDAVVESLIGIDGLGGLTKRTASFLIEHLLKAPKVAVAAAPKAYVAPGFYEHDGIVYRVRPSRSNPERCYADRLRIKVGGGGSWQYERGALGRLSEADRIDIDRAKFLGRSHGFCVICGAVLTDPDSIEAGIGPVCATRV